MSEIRNFFKRLLTPSSNKPYSFSPRDLQSTPPKKPFSRPPSESPVIPIPPNPYNLFLLCPRHAETDLVLEIYGDEMSHLLYLFHEKKHPGLSPGPARVELARRKKLTKDMKDAIKGRMKELEEAKDILIDPKQKAIVDEEYGGGTDCHVCEEQGREHYRRGGMALASYDESGSGLMSYPRPGSKEWRESTRRGRDFVDGKLDLTRRRV
ncbi:hypothetical protein TWF481_005551 [Arthrobotrys musiformis]|uniref:Uncharacterized protein n=1 Tax=Arthrobotrys musiformis TaxID=47236 RepID=A0AAV9WE45_9PEZI